ncbi:hypothetical protein GCM10025868_30220 [Angustibacter aerolatus]|uniref:Glycosyl hydrolase family 13 catalytic domain-containing protein n=1 Tax=Angustibacter aerolatus TaxID=1162965 RepID=A0ABQ6JJ33_9ACTN|nr:alpha-amylase family glycosyl hydrolase [Angustibacter aerolatus]GMA87772.1 hypothetical protein GCM10025868_30220 [Angustibacter aerolatus]
MPLLLPREGDSDGGYAVADYRAVRPDLGTLDDLRDLATRLRREGISLVLDLVLNHVAREHPWAVAARTGDERYRRYFHVFPDRTGPDAYERTLPEVFPATAPGNFTWDDEPRRLGLDDVQHLPVGPRLVEPRRARRGSSTSCCSSPGSASRCCGSTRSRSSGSDWAPAQNQPEVHAITQALRAVARIACPATVFKAEAIVGPHDLVHYLGQGRHHGRVSDLAYHNGLMVHVWSMLASGDVRLAARALAALPPVPSTTAWVAYVRCHDDIGWAVDDADAAAVGLDGHAHRAFLSDWYGGDFPGSWARGLVFQHDPATGDRRISGTAASLVGLADAVDPQQVDAALARLLLAHAIVLGWGGVPVLWSGDELGQPNDPHWADEPGHGDDNRWAHRPRLDPGAVARRHDPGTVPGRVFEGLQRLVRARAAMPHLDASVAAEVLTPSDPGVLPVLRRHPLGPLLEPVQRDRRAAPVAGAARARRGPGGRRRRDHRRPRGSRRRRPPVAAAVRRGLAGRGHRTCGAAGRSRGRPRRR